MLPSILSVTDNPSIEESLMGFALRMSEANHFKGMNWLADVMQVDRIYHLSARHVPMIAWLFGSNPSHFIDLTADSVPSKNEGHVHAYGQIITRPFLLRLRQPQVCPKCLAENGIIKKLWDFSLITCCHKHRITLLESCSQCGRRLTWRRPGVATCRCGFDLRDAKSIPAHSHAQHIASWFNARLNHATISVGDNPQSNSVISLLDSLSADGAMRLLWATGIQTAADESMGVGKARRCMTTMEAEQCVVRSFDRLHDLGSLHKLAAVRSTFVASALHAMIVDGLCDADRSLATQLLRLDKARENLKASVLYLNPLSQMKLF